MFGRLQRGALRQPEVDQQFGPVRGRKELLLYRRVEYDHGEHEDSYRNGDGRPSVTYAPRHGGPHTTVERRVVDVAAVLFAEFSQLVDIQQLVAEVGREHHRHQPGSQQGNGGNREDRCHVLAGCRPGKADRREGGCRDQRSGEHGKCCRRIREGGGIELVEALFDLHYHHLDGDDGIVDQQAKRDDQRAERNAVQIDAQRVHQDESHRQHQRNRQRDHHARAQAETEEAYRQDDDQRFRERLQEELERHLDDGWLVGNLAHFHAHRQVGGAALNLLCQVFAQLDDVAAAVHGHGDADRVFTADPHARAGGIDNAAFHVGDVGKPEMSPADGKVGIADALDRIVGTGHAQAHAVAGRFDETGLGDGILLRQRVRYLRGRQA